MSILVSYLTSLSASKEERIRALCFIKSHTEYLNELFELTASPKAKRPNVYAAWVWELYILEDLSRLEAYWNTLLLKMNLIRNPSMRRAHSKVIWHFLKEKNRSKNLCRDDKKNLISSVLDWIITKTKTAPLSFSIKILGLFFQDFPKLKTDLKGLLLDSKRTFPKGVYPTIRTVFKD